MQPAWEVLLDQTAFYPTSGGQPNDLGLLGEAVVLDVRDEEDDIVHIVDREVELGGVKGCVNWPRRFDHMQQHTGQHLLSAMAARLRSETVKRLLRSVPSISSAMSCTDIYLF